MKRSQLVLPFSIRDSTKWDPGLSGGTPSRTVHNFTLLEDVDVFLADHIDLPSYRHHPRRVGKPRYFGHWHRLYIGFVSSRYVDVQPWVKNLNRTNAGLDLARWAGFETLPHYTTIQRRFADLEEFEPLFRAAIRLMVARARELEPTIGWWVHVDSTASVTHGQLRHDCQPGDEFGCGGKRSPRMTVLSAGDVQEARQIANDAPPAVPEDEALELSEPSGDDRREFRTRYSEKRSIKRSYRREFRQGHWWRSDDPEAGLRSYGHGEGPTKFWHGYYLTQYIDHTTRIPLLSRVAPATTNESKIYTSDSHLLHEMLGEWPVAMAADRGYSLREVYEYNSMRGIGSVMPWRRTSPTIKAPQATDLFDEQGVPRCRHCGAGGDFHSFQLLNASEETGVARPVVRYQCSMPKQPKCRGVQQRDLSSDWTRLVPIWRTSRVYVELESSHASFEEVHHAMRTKYSLGPTSVKERPKRMGMPCQQLRATVASLVEWLAFVHIREFREDHPAAQPLVKVTSPTANMTFERMWRHRLSNGMTGGGVRPPRTVHSASPREK